MRPNRSDFVYPKKEKNSHTVTPSCPCNNNNSPTVLQFTKIFKWTIYRLILFCRVLNGVTNGLSGHPRRLRATESEEDGWMMMAYLPRMKPGIRVTIINIIFTFTLPGQDTWNVWQQNTRLCSIHTIVSLTLAAGGTLEGSCYKEGCDLSELEDQG